MFQQNGGIFYRANLKNVKKLDLIVLRITKEGNIGNARPCFNCLNMMKDIGIKKVYYTTGNNEEMICEHVKNMVSIQSSSVTRLIDVNNIREQEKYKLMKNKDYYYLDLFKNLFPKKIKYQNLVYFINYNFKNIFPNYNIDIRIDKVYFYNDKNMKILESIIE